MDLNEILVFARVVQKGSYTAAAAELDMPKSTVSRRVSDLEDRLNARLLQRTTRKLSLTDVGRTYYEYCARIVAEIEDAERAVTSLQDTPRGLLRVTCGPNSVYLAPIITDYLKQYPEVSLELVCTTRRVDLVEERFDLGIRAGTLPDSTLIARSLGRVSWWLVAAPAYLKKRGRPRTPEELAKHDCMFFGPALGDVGPQLEKDGAVARLAVSPRMTVNEMEILNAAAKTGLGIALLPAFQCVEDLHARRLERVLHGWNAPSVPLQAVYPSTRHLSPKVKTFVEHLQGRMARSRLFLQ
jgi:DNA-binding transcriptional LysR family regulator